MFKVIFKIYNRVRVRELRRFLKDIKDKPIYLLFFFYYYV